MNNLSDFMLPPAKSTLAAETDALFNFINVTSLIFLVGITIAIIYFSWKYMRRSDQDVTPVIAHDSQLEMTWSVIPLVLVLFVFVLGFTGYIDKIASPGDADVITALGKTCIR